MVDIICKGEISVQSLYSDLEIHCLRLYGGRRLRETNLNGGEGGVMEWCNRASGGQEVSSALRD